MSEAEGDQRKVGRPLGAGPVARLRRELLADGKLEKLIAKTYKLAMAGDLAAIRILLDRGLPPLRPSSEPVEFDLPAGTLTEQARALLEAAACGQLPADVASELIRAAAGVAAIDQGDEVRRRLDALEREDFGDLA